MRDESLIWAKGGKCEGVKWMNDMKVVNLR